MNAIVSQRAQGFTLVEVLVSVTILTIGLLGVAALQFTSIRLTQAAMFQSQAALLAHDMADRIRANPQGISRYTDFDSKARPAHRQDCVNHPCSATELAQYDLYQWQLMLAPNDSDEKSSPGQPTLPEGRGIVEYSPPHHVITILWQTSHKTPDISESSCLRGHTEYTQCLAIKVTL